MHTFCTACAARAGTAVAGTSQWLALGLLSGDGVNDQGSEPRSMPWCPDAIAASEAIVC